MRAGRLDRRLLIEAAEDKDDGYNTVRDWLPLTEVACQYIPAAGKEARELMGQQATMPATFIVRYSMLLAPILRDTEKHRVSLKVGDAWLVHDVKAAVNPDRRQTIHITAVATQP